MSHSRERGLHVARAVGVPALQGAQSRQPSVRAGGCRSSFPICPQCGRLAVVSLVICADFPPGKAACCSVCVHIPHLSREL